MLEGESSLRVAGRHAASRVEASLEAEASGLAIGDQAPVAPAPVAPEPAVPAPAAPTSAVPTSNQPTASDADEAQVGWPQTRTARLARR